MWLVRLFLVKRDAREACAACRRGFVGGWLLGCRNSAKSVLQKSELASLKQRTFVKQRRFPPAKNQLPSCRVRRQAAHASRAGFSRRQGRVAAREFGCKCWVEWSAGNAMRHQRCAGCLGGKAEFPCGLPGGGVASALRWMRCGVS